MKNIKIYIAVYVGNLILRINIYTIDGCTAFPGCIVRVVSILVPSKNVDNGTMGVDGVWTPDIFSDPSKSMFMNAHLVGERQDTPYLIHRHRLIFSPIPTYRSDSIKAEPFPIRIESIYSLDGSQNKPGGSTTENTSRPFLIPWCTKETLLEQPSS